MPPLTEQEKRTRKAQATKKRNALANETVKKQLAKAKSQARNEKLKREQYIAGFDKGLEMAEKIRRSQS